MTRADVFEKPVLRWIITNLQMIPIYRQRDGVRAPEKNKEIFQLMYKIFDRRGKIIIFPEASSIPESQLRTLRKGAARIAFDAYAYGTETKDMVVHPVGVNYSDHKSMYIDILVNYGDPIYIRDYEKVMQDNPNKAILQLTRTLKTELLKLCRHYPDLKFKAMYSALRDIYVGQKTGYQYARDAHLEQEFKLEKKMIAALETYRSSDEEAFSALHKQVLDFQDECDESGITPRLLEEGKPKFWRILIDTVTFVLMLPVFLLGLPFFYPPIWLIEKHVVSKLPEEQFVTSARFGSAMIAVPLYNLVCGMFVLLLFGINLWSLMAAVSFFAIPYAIKHCEAFSKRFLERLRWFFAPKSRRDSISRLNESRLGIISEVDKVLQTAT